MKILRQGDVCLVPVSSIPTDCKEVPLVDGAIVLAFGEVTGHKHQIADWKGAAKIAKDAIGLAGRRARLLIAGNGERYLEVGTTVTLKHEEHTPHKIPAGFYKLPVQMEHTTERVLRRVAD